ncbi:hypothetical protein ACJX0J_023976, partial [Zea mays]
ILCAEVTLGTSYVCASFGFCGIIGTDLFFGPQITTLVKCMHLLMSITEDNLSFPHMLAHWHCGMDGYFYKLMHLHSLWSDKTLLIVGGTKCL